MKGKGRWNYGVGEYGSKESDGELEKDVYETGKDGGNEGGGGGPTKGGGESDD